jgi:hypothetical protein
MHAVDLKGSHSLQVPNQSKSCYAVEQVPLLGNQEDTQRIGLVVRTQRIILLAVA